MVGRAGLISSDKPRKHATRGRNPDPMTSHTRRKPITRPGSAGSGKFRGIVAPSSRTSRRLKSQATRRRVWASLQLFLIREILSLGETWYGFIDRTV